MGAVPGAAGASIRHAQCYRASMEALRAPRIDRVLAVCRAVRFTHAGTAQQQRFEHRDARLPVLTRGGAQVLLLPWGRRPREHGTLPVGGWAKLPHIQAGLWDQFAPRPVKLPVRAFAECDVIGRTHWFEVTRSRFIQGCVVQIDRERRVYVVTLDCAPTETEFERWPRLVSHAPGQTSVVCVDHEGSGHI